MTTISANLQAVLARIDVAARQHGRDPQDVVLLAVSKTWPVSCIREALAAGQRSFGENYVQEGVAKVVALQDTRALGVAWHFIGPLQSNKTRQVAEHFDWLHSLERLKIAERLAEQRPTSLLPLSVCLQINVSGESTKSGVTLAEAPALARAIAGLPGLRLRGLMAIPEAVDDFAAQRIPFRRLHELYEQLRADGLELDTLSMGMSHDLEAAIAEGATLVRVGTAIFGERSYA
jgi:pyridoxal phosphate enzyme (YggS family)